VGAAAAGAGLSRQRRGSYTGAAGAGGCALWMLLWLFCVRMCHLALHICTIQVVHSRLHTKDNSLVLCLCQHMFLDCAAPAACGSCKMIQHSCLHADQCLGDRDTPCTHIWLLGDCTRLLVLSHQLCAAQRPLAGSCMCLCCMLSARVAAVSTPQHLAQTCVHLTSLNEMID
jgi:hypothetical protein